jgi:hypothetical protein
VGEFVIVKKEYRTKRHYPLKVIATRDEQELIVKWKNGKSLINTLYFELATEEEIKMHKIKSIINNVI